MSFLLQGHAGLPGLHEFPSLLSSFVPSGRSVYTVSVCVKSMRCAPCPGNWRRWWPSWCPTSRGTPSRTTTRDAPQRSTPGCHLDSSLNRSVDVHRKDQIYMWLFSCLVHMNYFAIKCKSRYCVNEKFGSYSASVKYRECSQISIAFLFKIRYDKPNIKILNQFRYICLFYWHKILYIFGNKCLIWTYCVYIFKGSIL